MDIDTRSITSMTPFEEGTDDFVGDSWSRRLSEPDRPWRDRLTQELQPVVESLGRLRDRDLLD
ncbi:MAG TPA: hypothetical protein VGO64_10155 [Candidatus Limnocylindrales bacterium]|jgi:hypothetical protein|nr:hypothetical protein [Candidatus Limnocylindrales bacterium]